MAQHAVDQMHNVELVGCMLVSKTYGIPGRCQSMSVVDADEVYGGGAKTVEAFLRTTDLVSRRQP